MSDLISKVKSAVGAAKSANDPCSYILKNRIIVCSHCENNVFHKGSALLNTSGMTFLGLDWANKEATVLSCQSCGQIQWFAIEPEKVTI